MTNRHLILSEVAKIINTVGSMVFNISYSLDESDNSHIWSNILEPSFNKLESELTILKAMCKNNLE